MNQWKDPHAIEEIQQKRFKEILSHAVRRVPFYRKRYGNSGFRNLEDRSSLQLTDKCDVLGNPSAFICADYQEDALRCENTSGSTGTKLCIRFSDSEADHRLAMEYVPITEYGVGPFDLQARISHLAIPPCFIQKAGLFRSHFLSVQEDEGDMLSRLADLRPSVLHGYPSVISTVAKLNLALKNPLALKNVFCFGEVALPASRELIRQSFGCRVCNMYGATEISWIAYECEKGSLHVLSDSVLVEVTDDDGTPLSEGKIGNIVVTSLFAKAMPLIRYKLGDRGSLKKGCACGRGSQVLGSLEGREDDLLVLPSGKIRSAFSINVLEEIINVSNYQIIQERPDLFLIRYVPLQAGVELDGKEKDAIRKSIMDGCLGEKVSVEFEMAGRIGKGSRGKMKLVISKVPNKGI